MRRWSAVLVVRASTWKPCPSAGSIAIIMAIAMATGTVPVPVIQFWSVMPFVLRVVVPYLLCFQCLRWSYVGRNFEVDVLVLASGWSVGFVLWFARLLACRQSFGRQMTQPCSCCSWKLFDSFGCCICQEAVVRWTSFVSILRVLQSFFLRVCYHFSE